MSLEGNLVKRLFLSLIVAFIAVGGAVLPAGAQWEWCKSDPIVRLNGVEVQILVAIPADMQPEVTGPVEVEIRAPRGVLRELLLTDAGFNGFGETVEFADLRGGEKWFAGKVFPVHIHVKVPSDRNLDMPVQVTVIPENDKPVVEFGDGPNTHVNIMVASMDREPELGELDQ